MDYALKLDDKRRVALPVRLLEEAAIAVGEPLAAKADGPGRLVLETRAAIAARIRERARIGRERVGRQDDAVESLLRDRAESAA